MRHSKILFIIGQYYPVIGGAENQAKRLAAKLHSLDYRVEVLTIHRRGLPLRETIDDIPVCRIAFCSFGIFKIWLSRIIIFFHILIHGRKYVCLHVHGGNDLAAVAVMAGRMVGVPIVVKLVNSGERFDFKLLSRNFTGRYFVRILVKGVTRFAATTPQIKEELMAFGVAENRIKLIPNGIELPELPAIKVENYDSLRIVIVARLVKQKNIQFIIETLARAEFPYRVEIHGDGSEMATLRNLVKKHNMTDWVDFAGLSDQETVSRSLTAAEVFVNPSLAEGLSNSLLEAMSLGVPVLLNDLPSNRFVLGDDLASKCCVPLETNQWLAKLKRLFDDTAYRQQIGRDVKKRASYFDINAVAGEYVGVYMKLAATGEYEKE